MFPFLIPANTIMVWQPIDVPQEIAFTIQNDMTSDVMWVAFVPSQFTGQYISFLASSSFSADGGPQKIDTAYGSIYLGRNPL